VRLAIERGVDIAALPLETLRGFHASIGEDVREVLTLEGALAARATLGGTAPAQVRAQIARHQARLAG
jgi:argininosuccinate lyase